MCRNDICRVSQVHSNVLNPLISGGSGRQGLVTGIANTVAAGRSVVKVKWDANGSELNYRRGLDGKMEVKCVKDANGEGYYVDHLSLLGWSPLGCLTLSSLVGLTRSHTTLSTY